MINEVYIEILYKIVSDTESCLLYKVKNNEFVRAKNGTDYSRENDVIFSLKNWLIFEICNNIHNL
jgi:hypothetical protein